MCSAFQVNYVFCISGELSVLSNFNLLVLYCLVTTLITFLVKEKDGSMTLKKTHDYWHQIKGQLHLSGTHCCDFVVWTLVDLKIVRILKDSSWAQTISTMLDFYFSKFLPSLSEWWYSLFYTVSYQHENFFIKFNTCVLHFRKGLVLIQLYWFVYMNVCYFERHLQ